MTCSHLQRVCFDLKEYSNEAVLKHEHFWCICFEIHLSVQAPFYGAGVEESTVMKQHCAESMHFYSVHTNTHEKGEARQKSIMY